MLNDPGEVDQRDPKNWGGPEPLPAGKIRIPSQSAWERLLATQPLLPGARVRSDWFTLEMRQAGDEIGWVFMAVSGALMSRSQMGERTDKSPETQWSERLAVAYRDRYKPWALAMKSHQSIMQEPVHSLILDLALEDISVSEAERRNGVWRGKGLKLVEYGLSMYVSMAGWDSRRSQKSRH
jgi:hypothetical protein